MSQLQLRLGLAKAARSSASQDRGPLVATLALSLAFLVAALGVTVDYSSASNMRASLDAIADATVLGGVSATSIAASAQSEQRETWLQERMRQDFEAQFGSRPGLRETLKATNFSVEIIDDTITATTCYQADQPTIFSRFLGQEPILVMNCVSATSAPETADETMMPLVDTSRSTGIASVLPDPASVAATPGDKGSATERFARTDGGRRQVRLSR